MTKLLRSAAGLSLLGLLIGLAGVAPAQADDFRWRDGQERHHIRRDIAEIRRDERRLEELERLRDRQVRRRDWREVRETEWRIRILRRQIAEARAELRRDMRRNHRDRDRY